MNGLKILELINLVWNWLNSKVIDKNFDQIFGRLGLHVRLINTKNIRKWIYGHNPINRVKNNGQKNEIPVGLDYGSVTLELARGLTPLQE